MVCGNCSLKIHLCLPTVENTNTFFACRQANNSPSPYRMNSKVQRQENVSEYVLQGPSGSGDVTDTTRMENKLKKQLLDSIKESTYSRYRLLLLTGVKCFFVGYLSHLFTQKSKSRSKSNIFQAVC